MQDCQQNSRLSSRARRVVACRALGTALFVLWLAFPAEAGWRAGAAKRCITPAEPMWMSGYAARNRPAEGTLNDLWAKALVLEDEAGRRLVLITLDLVGIHAGLTRRVKERIATRHGTEGERIALCSSHTHSGPVVGHNLGTMYFLDSEQQKKVQDYARSLEDWIVQVVDVAFAGLEPVEAAWGSGSAGFAVNRRTNPEAAILTLRTQGSLSGPVDHTVPVLRLTKDGEIRAIVFGYACHATVLPFYRWSSDYPGFAQTELEERYPGAVALFWAGCGADINPLPRRRVQLARLYGETLAASAASVVDGEMRTVKGALRAGAEEIALDFARLPDRAELEEAAESRNRYEANRARMLLQRLASEGSLSGSYPYPLQAWQLGDGPAWLFLGGEVVVDYALRIRRDLGEDNVWVAAYANDVMAYIPSLRVLREGGYEGGGAMVYYGQPAVWSEQVETQIMTEITRQAASK
jgi:hypothetical protein